MRSTTKPPELRRPVLAVAALAATGLLAVLLIRPEVPEPGVAPAPSAPEPPMPAMAPAPPAPAPPSAEGLRLVGLLGLGAVIATPEGRQSFFPIGREVRPGLSVARVEQYHVVLASAGGEIRLGFDGVSAGDPAPAESSAPAQSSGPSSAGDEALAYRFGLAARRSNGRITGYEIRHGANLPRLQQAGLRPGDVLVSVNGQTFDSDEKVLELPAEISGSFTAEFEFERNGRPMRTSLQVNPRT